jgi:hypothetical protein
MPRRLTSSPAVGDSLVACPECGASVPLVGLRWLAVHREGSAEYVYPRGARDRCPGSLLAVGPAKLQEH